MPGRKGRRDCRVGHRKKNHMNGRVEKLKKSIVRETKRLRSRAQQQNQQAQQSHLLCRLQQLTSWLSYVLRLRRRSRKFAPPKFQAASAGMVAAQAVPA